jgi:hypothetical protein
MIPKNIIEKTTTFMIHNFNKDISLDHDPLFIEITWIERSIWRKQHLHISATKGNNITTKNV